MNEKKGLMYNILYFCVIIGIALLLNTFVTQRIVVSGSSMNDTLEDGDNLFIDKLSYLIGEPERFDIVVFPVESYGVYYIKRIIGLPGETVQIDDDGNIYINGEILEESYGKEVIQDSGIAGSQITLGDDEYFVLGDNRNNSKDSRYVGVGNIKREDLIGRVVIRVWPITKFGIITK